MLSIRIKNCVFAIQKQLRFVILQLATISECFSAAKILKEERTLQCKLAQSRQGTIANPGMWGAQQKAVHRDSDSLRRMMGGWGVECIAYILSAQLDPISNPYCNTSRLVGVHCMWSSCRAKYAVHSTTGQTQRRRHREQTLVRRFCIAEGHKEKWGCWAPTLSICEEICKSAICFYLHSQAPKPGSKVGIIAIGVKSGADIVAEAGGQMQKWAPGRKIQVEWKFCAVFVLKTNTAVC